MSVALAPLKAYAILVYIIAAAWSREIRGEPMLLFMVLGYCVCLVLFLVVGISQRVGGHREAARGTFLWSAVVLILGFAFTWCWLPTLAQ